MKNSSDKFNVPYARFLYTMLSAALESFFYELAEFAKKADGSGEITEY